MRIWEDALTGRQQLGCGSASAMEHFDLTLPLSGVFFYQTPDSVTATSRVFYWIKKTVPGWERLAIKGEDDSYPGKERLLLGRS